MTALSNSGSECEILVLVIHTDLPVKDRTVSAEEPYTLIGNFIRLNYDAKKLATNRNEVGSQSMKQLIMGHWNLKRYSIIPRNVKITTSQPAPRRNHFVSAGCIGL